ncbi:DUF1592 domain-containing protein [Stieleria marina]|uniref:DUF1592 domain-containing protein n=1 Tax=Stieleria marina TaxID=1930275 RepID=UPI003AF35BB7
MRTFLVGLACAYCAVVGAKSIAADQRSNQASAGFKSDIAPFLSTHCMRCHGADAQKGDRRFDWLDGSIADENVLVDYQDILDQLNLGEMPPADEKQPSDTSRRRVIQWLTRRIEMHHQMRSTAHGVTALRRLNAREYSNTVRDLLHLNMQMFDPTATFPKDETVEHLDNNGEALVTSGYLLSRYLTAADQVVQRAIGPIDQPKPQTWTFRSGFRQQPEIDQVHRKTNKFSHMTLYDVIGADKHEGAYGPIDQFRDGVPIDGFYEIKIKAEAVNRFHPYDDEFLGTDRAEPLRLGIRPGNRRVGKLHLPQPIEPLLAEIELADEQKWYTTRVWLDKGFTPRFTFRNGLMDARSLWTKLIKKYPDQFPDNIANGIVAKRFNAIQHGKLPQIRLHEIEIRGPLFSQWPTRSQRELLGKDLENAASGADLQTDKLREHLVRFMTRAYRRPVKSDELDRVLTLIKSRKSGGRNSLQAFGDGIKAVLCSPSFLYLDEGERKTLSNHALASRLAYFLWSSMPDQRLTDLAESGELADNGTLRREVDRLLNAPQSDAMIHGFLDSWLTLRDLGAAPPDRGIFREYYQYDLVTAMRTESQLFARHLIDQDLSLVNFIDSNFSFANKRLAMMYGIDAPPGPDFQRVLFDDDRRGGLLGQASVLTVSANGIDTSPVVRGVWVLENFLGTPPSPPPPDVEPLDPDTRNAKTIREQLQKHRKIASCNDCHRKIDPLGFALENYDPIGRWRTHYRRTPIDASGKLPDGQSFDDIVGLKALLMQRQRPFAKSLTEKLLAYAMGRSVTANDRPDVEQILNRVESSDWGFRELIHQIVQSDSFHQK